MIFVVFMTHRFPSVHLRPSLWNWILGVNALTLKRLNVGHRVNWKNKQL